MGAKISVHGSEKKDAAQFLFQSSVIKIGSLESNEVILKGKKIEPIHALLYFHQGKWTLENISGSEDLFYNKKVVSSSCFVAENGEIVISDNRIVLEMLEIIEELKSPEQEKEYSKKERRRRKNLLFKPRKGEATGDALEVISYWDDRVIAVEHFGEKNPIGTIFIGSSEQAHFSTSNVRNGENLYRFCDYTQDSFTLHLVKGMTARVRKDGQYISLEPGEHILKKGDVAHIHYFSTRFFFVHKTLPHVHVPRETLEDPLFAGLLTFFLVSYVFLCSSFYLVEVPEKEINTEEIWAVVEKEVELEPKKIDVEEIKKEKVEEKKEIPKKDSQQETEQLNKAVVASKKKEAPKKGLNEQDKKKPMPVEASPKKNSSGLNLSTAGLGLGDIKSHGGLGAIPTKLNKAATGAAEGSAKKTFGLGGVGKDLSKADLIALNTKDAEFEDASKSLADGNLNSQFEREGSAELQIRSGNPLIGAGIDKKAVWDVLMSAQRAINHCYNTLLQRDRTAAGTITLSIIVDSRGKAPKSKVEKSEITDSVMQECLLNVIRRLTFPKPEGVDEVEFKMPYGFSPES